MSQVFGTFSLVQVQGFCRILPDFRGDEQPSLLLKVLMAKDFRLVQQALLSRLETTFALSQGFKPLAGYCDRCKTPHELRTQQRMKA